MMMNTFSITVKEDQTGDDRPYSAIHIAIDGRDLCDMLKDYEMPFAAREGHPHIAGGYAGLDTEPLPKNWTGC